jgi:hypothetical protein
MKEGGAESLSKIRPLPSFESFLVFASATLFINWQFRKQLATAHKTPAAAFLTSSKDWQKRN